MGKMRNACKILDGNIEGKRPLGRPRYGWQEIIKMNLSMTEWHRRE
jgi:hypothetical protein